MSSFLFGCRIVALEYKTEVVAQHMLRAPLSRKPIASLPAVYIFGPTTDNEQCCLMIQEWFPYIYIDWPENLKCLFDEEIVASNKGLYWSEMLVNNSGIPHHVESKGVDDPPKPPFHTVEEFVLSLCHFLDSVVTVSQDGPVVYTIEIVLRRSIYGYTQRRRPFFKIFFLDINFIPMAAQRLFQGHFYGIVFQPYNLHVLGHEFMMDHNLFGMDILWAQYSDLRENTQKTIMVEKSYILNAHCIRNKYALQQIEPDTKKDRESLMNHQETLQSPRLCCPSFVFATNLRNKHNTLWRDLCAEDFMKLNTPDVTSSLKEFWNEEVRRRRRLKGDPPELLRTLQKKEQPRLISNPVQLVPEDLRPMLQNLCPGHPLWNYKFYTSDKEIWSSAIQNADVAPEPSQEVLVSNLEKEGHGVWSHPAGDNTFAENLKYRESFDHVIKPNIQQGGESKSRACSLFFYSSPPPRSSMLIERCKASEKPGLVRETFSDTGFLATSSTYNATTKNSSDCSRQETCPDKLSGLLSECSESAELSFCDRQLQPVKRRSQTKRTKALCLLNMLRRRKRERQYKLPSGVVKKKPISLIETPSSCCIPQFSPYHIVANPRTDALLGIVYVLREENFSVHKDNVFTETQFDTYTDTVGVVEVWSEQSGVIDWDICTIPVSGEVYRATLAPPSFFLSKGTTSLPSNIVKFYVPTEHDLIYWILDKLFRKFNPLIVLSFDQQNDSLGFILSRARVIGFVNPELHFHRIIPAYPLRVLRRSNIGSLSFSQGRRHVSFHGGSDPPKLCGRIVFNILHLTKEHHKSVHDTLHGLTQHLLRIMFPFYPVNATTEWWQCRSVNPNVFPLRDFTFMYKIRCLQVCFKVLDHLELLKRYGEQSRFLGMDIVSTMTRGSQYKIEGLIARAASALGYVLLTAAKIQVARQPAIMSLPLVLEPESHFYRDPVIVLDFQSLYPSIIIAYNICFSTCLGRYEHHTKDAQQRDQGVFKGIPLGVLTEAAITPLGDLPHKHKKGLPLFVSPNGILFVTRSIRKGILPSLLEDVISTRVAIKRSLAMLHHLESSGNRGVHGKDVGTSSIRQEVRLRKMLEYRELALKLFANCTYGYTCASFSGRMPCSEVAETIVEIARCTLNRAITFIESHPKWNARVVYGDTDSLFVLVERRSLPQAFSIGREITKAITRLNPWPVELRMEKVYHPCCLETKKRYVGLKYVSETATPSLDSKGIETIRRDQCCLVSKCLTSIFTMLFTGSDLAQVKTHLMDLWARMHLGEPYVSLLDFLFYRKLKLGSYVSNYHDAFYKLPPQAIVAYRMFESWHCGADDKIEYFFPYGKRVPYIVANTLKKSRLVDMVRSPWEISGIGKQPFSPLCPTEPQYAWSDQHLTINTEWYIRNHMIPILDRHFCVIQQGVSAAKWYMEFPRLLYHRDHIKLSIIPRYHTRKQWESERKTPDYPSFDLRKKLTCRILKTVNKHQPIQSVLKKVKRIRVCSLCNVQVQLQEDITCESNLKEVKDLSRNFFCNQCRQSPDSHLWKLYSAWNLAEQRFSKYMRACIHCAGSRFAAEACHNAFHCPIYTARNDQRLRLYQAVMDIEDYMTQ